MILLTSSEALPITRENKNHVLLMLYRRIPLTLPQLFSNSATDLEKCSWSRTRGISYYENRLLHGLRCCTHTNALENTKRHTHNAACRATPRHTRTRGSRPDIPSCSACSPLCVCLGMPLVYPISQFK